MTIIYVRKTTTYTESLKKAFFFLSLLFLTYNRNLRILLLKCLEKKNHAKGKKRSQEKILGHSE